MIEYVNDIGYDEYGQRVYIKYGNGVETTYKYDPARRWLDTIKTENDKAQIFQNITYSFDAVGNVLGYENNCLDNVTGNYKTAQTYGYDNLYQLIHVEGETTYNPYRSGVPEFVSNYRQDFTFDELGLGNMTGKASKETVRPQKKIGDDLNYEFDYIYDENYAHRLVRAGERYYKYDSNGNIICEQTGSFDGDEVTYHKREQERDGVFSTDYGWGLFKEDKTGSTTSRYKRTYTWNERNQLISSVDPNHSVAYVYGQDGQRSNKYTASSETLYFNKMWTHHTDSGNSIYGGQTSKNIYLGETRIVTKLNAGTEPTYQEEYYKQYYYHSDHLGSAAMISDHKGDEYQRIEYTPYGETWVEKTQNTGLEYLPYKFTAKELDEETGLYYYGARYLDPKYSMWLSTDPALSDYIPAVGKATIEEAGKLAGQGGIFNSVNGNLYHYAGNNPVKYVDPDGRAVHVAIGAVIGAAVSVGAKAIGDMFTHTQSSFSDYVGAAFGGAATGAVLAATGNSVMANAAAGVVGGAVASITQQGIDVVLEKQSGLDLGEIAKDAAIGGAIGATLPGCKVPGITSGKGSMQAVTNQMRTKLANKTIKNVTLKTSAKMAVSRQVNGALVEGTIIAPFVEKAVDRGLDTILPEEKSSAQKPIPELSIKGMTDE